ncbi:MAG: hypothetical protein QM775_21125 [Pirellulales bacterium]
MAAALALAGLLVALGIGLYWRESVVARGLGSAAEEDVEFLRTRTRRRIRIALLIGFTGLLMGIGGWVSPRQRPTIFIASWSAAMLATLWLLWLAAMDLFSVRLHWNERTRRNMADIAHAKQQLKAFHKSPEDRTTLRGGM